MTGGVAVPDGVDDTGTSAGDRSPKTAVEPEPATPVRASAQALTVFVAIPVLVVILDQVVKQLSIAHLVGSPPVRLLGGLVYLNLTFNSGAAYSLGVNITYIFPIVAVAVIGLIVWLSRRLRSVPWAISFGLVVGGALGNVADRLFRAPGFFRGQVVDMISLFDPAGHVFPPGAIFNIADSALFCGVVVAIVLEFSGRRRDGTRASREERSQNSRPGHSGHSRTESRSDDRAEA